MKKTVTAVGTPTMPHAYITKRKQRVKQFNQTVYLQNGDEFEIELFNPTTTKVLAKIEINGNPIGGTGIVLRPGERVFLERYLNDAKKFLFETYKVSGKSLTVEQAIKNNGDVVVKFYGEYIQPFNNVLITNINTWKEPYWYNTHTTSDTLTNDSSPYTLTTTSLYNTKSVTSDTLSFDSSEPTKMKKLRHISKLSEDRPKEIETGRIEKGSNSNQSFTYDYTQFNSYHFVESVWKILPESQKPIMKEDLVLHCTECGRKRKKDTHKFCPHCGTKY